MLPLLWIAALLAQNQAPPAAASVFRSGTDVVRLDIRVADDAGRPIADLRPEELRIVDEGRPRLILLFERVEQPAGDLGEAAARAVTSAISTNDGAPTGHLFVLVFDQSHITAGNEQRARRAAEQFLRTYVRRGDRVAVYALPGPGPQIGFTADVARASASLVQVRGGLERTGMGALGSMRVDEAYEITRGNQEVLTRVVSGLSSAANFTDMVGMVVQRQAGGDPTIFTRLVQEDARTIVARADSESRQFLQRFADLVQQLRDIEGRKAVVLFSEGFFADNVSRELEQVAAAAARSYGAIYAVDLNQREIDPRQVSGSGGEQFGEIHARIGPLATLAAETDGVLLNDANSWMSRALARAAGQSVDYYLVGFEPSAEALRNRAGYHRVKVQVTRPGAHVSARTGYSLAAPAPPARRDALDRALRSPFAQHGIRIEYTTYQIRGQETGRESVILALEAELPLVSADPAARADIVFVVRSVADGRTVASGTDVIPLPRAADRGSTAGTGRYRVRFEIPAGDYIMRAVVREPGGLVGSADRRLVVRRLDAPALTAGDLVLSSSGGGLPVRAVAYAAHVLTGSLAVYARTAEQLDRVTVTVELLPAGRSDPVTSIRADLSNAAEDGGGPWREARIALPLEGVSAGDYIARAVVRDGTEQVVELLRDVQILHGAAPAAAGAPEEPRRIALASGDLVRRYLEQLARDWANEPTRAAAALALERQWDKAREILAADSSPAGDAVRGITLLALGDFESAINAFDRRLAAAPRDALASFFQGWAHAEAGRDREAIGTWRSAIYLDPRLIPAHLALVEAYLRLSEPALAVQVVRAGLRAVPDSPELRERLDQLERRP